MRLRDWLGQRIRLFYPGHPDHMHGGKVLAVKRQTDHYEQRAWVLWDDGDSSYVPVANLRPEE